MSKTFVTIIGNIGAGKSTQIEILRQEGAHIVQEIFESNLYLKDCEETKKYFHCQSNFLIDQFE